MEVRAVDDADAIRKALIWIEKEYGSAEDCLNVIADPEELTDEA